MLYGGYQPVPGREQPVFVWDQLVPGPACLRVGPAGPWTEPACLRVGQAGPWTEPACLRVVSAGP